MGMKVRGRDNVSGYLFIAPWLIGLLLFRLGPFGFSFILSLTKWDMISKIEFIGLQNYRHLLKDPLFWTALLNTLYYFLWVPLGVIAALPIALLLNRSIRGITVFRAIYYLPSVTAATISSLIWIWMLHPHYGVINSMLSRIGIEGPLWFASPQWAMPGLILVRMFYIGPLIVIFLAGLKSIPVSLYEAARLDGASSWTCFRYVTIPMLSPVIFFNFVMYSIQAFQAFTEPYVMTSGGPMNRTLVFVMYLYNNAFAYFRMGYATTLAWVLFLIILVFTVVQLRLSRRWVHY